MSAYSFAASTDLVNALRCDDGLAVDAARRALATNADPNSYIFDLRQPKLEGLVFPALAYASFTALQPQYAACDRHALLLDMIDRGADRPQAAGMLLVAYADFWQDCPGLARRMVIGLHNLHAAFEPYLAGRRPLPGTACMVRPNEAGRA